MLSRQKFLQSQSSASTWHKEEHCPGNIRDDWMNKAGIGTAYYYLTSVDSVPKTRNIGNSWNSFCPSFSIIAQHKLYKHACYQWYLQMDVLQTKFHINIILFVERLSPNVLFISSFCQEFISILTRMSQIKI